MPKLSIIISDAWNVMKSVNAKINGDSFNWKRKTEHTTEITKSKLQTQQLSPVQIFISQHIYDIRQRIAKQSVRKKIRILQIYSNNHSEM